MRSSQPKHLVHRVINIVGQGPSYLLRPWFCSLGWLQLHCVLWSLALLAGKTPPCSIFSVSTAEVWDHTAITAGCHLVHVWSPRFALGIKLLLWFVRPDLWVFGNVTPWKLIWLWIYFLSVSFLGKWTWKPCVNKILACALCIFNDFVLSLSFLLIVASLRVSQFTGFERRVTCDICSLALSCLLLSGRLVVRLLENFCSLVSC